MQRVGPYEVLEELGRGGMGVVYRARKAGSGREVALKVLLAPLADPEERVRFEREAHVLGGFRHPGIIPVHDAGVSAEGFPYLALAVMPGGSLQDRLREQGRLEPRRAAEITRKLAVALGHAHRKGVLHRDLKPHNVLFDEDDEPVLTDFGLARIAQRDKRLTTTGEILGTPAYMSPEQANGDLARIGPVSDVYGLGATLYAMLAGDPPFLGGSVLAVLSKVVSEAAPAPLPAEVDPALAAICLRCLAKAPESRYLDAVSLEDALAGWLSQSTSRGRGVRSRLLVLSVVVALSVVGLGVALGLRSAGSDSGGTSGEVAEPGSAPRSVKELLAEAARACEAEDWLGALGLTEQALRRERGPETLHARATALWGVGRRDEALAALRAAVELGPTLPKPRFALARMLQSWKDDSGVLRELEVAWRLDPRQFDAQARGALVERRSLAGRYADALPLIEALLKEGKSDRATFWLAGNLARWRLWRRKEAVAQLRAWLRTQPEGKHRRVGRKRLARFEADMAESAKRRIRKGDARLLSLVSAARGWLSRRDRRKATAVIQQALAIRRAPIVLTYASQCAGLAGEEEEALELVLEGLRYSHDAKSAAACAFRAALAMAISDKPLDTERYLNRSIDLGGSQAWVLSYRGMFRLDKGYYEEAFSDFRRALALDPKARVGLVGGGWEHYRAGRYVEALANHVRALGPRLSPRVALQAQEGRAAALVKLDQLDEAEPILDQVLKRLPSNHRARFARAALHWARKTPAGREAALVDQRAGLEELSATHPDRPAQVRELERMRAEIRRR